MVLVNHKKQIFLFLISSILENGPVQGRRNWEAGLWMWISHVVFFCFCCKPMVGVL